MSTEYFIIGAAGGALLYAVWSYLSCFEWTERRCKKGKPCGCRTLTYGCGMYRVCEDRPEQKGGQS
jgi:hypothetical protein